MIDILLKCIMGRFVIGISGASCSGKSWLAQQIHHIAPTKVCIFEMDKYYKEFDYVKNIEFQYDNPNAIDYDRALADCRRLLNGNTINSPIYDYTIHEVVGWSISTPAPVLIIEGLFAFVDERFRNLMDVKIWVEAKDKVRYERRISRDITERGDNPTDAQRRYEQDVVPAFYKYIKQYISYADFILENNNNRYE